MQGQIRGVSGDALVPSTTPAAEEAGVFGSVSNAYRDSGGIHAGSGVDGPPRIIQGVAGKWTRDESGGGIQGGGVIRVEGWGGRRRIRIAKDGYC